VGASILVGGVLGVTVGITYLSLYDTIHQFKVMLCSPETSSSKINLFHSFDIVIIGQRYIFFSRILDFNHFLLVGAALSTGMNY
jgi:hypothetical protein